MPSKKRKIAIRAGIASIVVLLIAGYLTWDVLAGGPLMSWFNDRGALISWVRDLGPFGPLAYIFLQIVQTIVAPIPGNFVGGLGGFLFGWTGVIWTTIGSAIGAYFVFFISRKLGRRLVDRFVKKELIEKFDFVMGDNAKLILFIIYLIPGLPDDVVCYVAGLTKVPIRELVALFVIGRTPSVIVTNYIGAGLEQGNITGVVIVGIIAMIIIGIIYWQQDRIIKLLGATSRSMTEIDKLKRENKKLKSDIEDLADDGKLNKSNKKK